MVHSEEQTWLQESREVSWGDRGQGHIPGAEPGGKSVQSQQGGKGQEICVLQDHSAHHG